MRALTLLALLFAIPALAGPPGGGPGDRDRRPVLELIEDVKERELQILTLVKENDPGRYEQLMQAKEDDERSYWRQMIHVARMVERFQGDPEYAKRALEMRELQRRVKELAKGWAHKNAQEQKAARAEMEGVVAELFEMKQAERRERLAELQAKISELENDIAERDKTKKAKIDEYLEQMIVEKVDL